MNTSILRPIRSAVQRRTASLSLTLGIAISPGFVARAQSGDPAATDERVSGAFVTNFIAEDQTAGTATGDLKGALGVKVLATVSGTVGDGKPVTLKVVHFWVTETGDTIQTEEAEVTAYPGASPSQPLLYSFVYENGAKVTGGTGKFDGATGVLRFWGGLDLGAGQVAGRYAGTISFQAPSAPPTLEAGAVQDGAFRFQVHAPSGRPVTAEVSANLTQWDTLETKENPSGTVEFTDGSVAAHPQRFYRAKEGND